MIITFIGLLGLFLAKKGFLTRFLDNKFSVFLGQFTFSIFVTHAFVIKLWSICAHKNVFIVNPTITFLLVYVSIVLFGVLTYYLVEKPTSKYFKNKFLKY
jgi:peptidoglycan/LPS O-acetylase OafA/YrhL